MNKDTWRAVINLVSALATIGFNGLAVGLPLNGRSTGAISDTFKVFFVPAGYVFAIWSVIYLGWLAFSIYQLLPARRADPRLQRAGYLFALSGVANCAWLVCWHYGYYVASVGVMLVLLGLLIAIYLRLDIGRVQVGAAERWCVDIPMSVYLGWITVATLANFTSALYDLRWDGWGVDPQVWAVILCGAAVAVAAAITVTRHDVAFQAVLVWALVGIAVKQAAVPLVAGGAWTAAALVAATLLLAVYLGLRQPPAKTAIA